MKTFSIRKLTLIVAAMAVAGCELTGAQPAGYQAQLRLAEQFLGSGRYDRAYEVFDGVDAANMKSAEVQLALGESYMRGYAFLKAERAYETARALGAVEEAEIGFGRIALARNEPDRARVIFASVLARMPDSAIALNGMGVALDLQGWHDGAQNRYREALALDTTMSEARNNLGLSLILSGDYLEAARVLSELAASELDNRQARQNLAVAYHLMGRRSDALELATFDMDEATALALFRSFELRLRAPS